MHAACSWTPGIVPHRKPTTFATVDRGGRIKPVFALPGEPFPPPRHWLGIIPVPPSPCRQSCLLHGHLLPLRLASPEENGRLEEHPAYYYLHKGESTIIPPSVNSLIISFSLHTQLSSAIKLDPRPEYHRAVLTWSPSDPVPLAVSTGSQCSSRLLSMKTATALMVLPPRTEQLNRLEAGTTVQAILVGKTL